MAGGYPRADEKSRTGLRGRTGQATYVISPAVSVGSSWYSLVTPETSVDVMFLGNTAARAQLFIYPSCSGCEKADADSGWSKTRQIKGSESACWA